MRIPCHEQQWLTALKCRSTLATEEQKQLIRLEKGLKGEQYLDWLFETFGPENVPCYDDITLKHGQTTVQIDKLFLVKDTVYLLDAKAYHGAYTYKGHKWRGENFSFDTDIFHQLEKAHNVIENIFETTELDLTVDSYLVFTEKDLTLEIPEYLKKRALQINEATDLFRKLSSESITPDEKQQKINQRFLAILEKAKQPRFRTTRTLTLAQMPRLTKGLFCENCHSFNVKVEAYRLICRDCHHRESKEKAFVRTVCDCGLIFHDQELTVGLLRKFFGKDYSQSFMNKVLGQHFPVIENKARKTSHLNQGLPMYEWFEEKREYFEKTEIKANWSDRNIKNSKQPF